MGIFTCLTHIQSVKTHFQNIFENTNDMTSLHDIEPVSEEEDIEIKIDEINSAIATLKEFDTSPGRDHVIVRAIKELGTSKLLCLLANAMLKLKQCPQIFKKARTILLFKSGNVDEVSNWRPISIFSVIRRIIEKVIDKRLRSY